MAGRYRLARKLGEGGMGTVWAAKHTVTDKMVALKMLHPETAQDAQVRTRFLREARASCAVRHPHIVEIHDVLELDDGAPCMVMEYLDGESLGERLVRERSLPIPEFARIMASVVSAVGAAHAAGIVHRDLKPDNIFLVNEPGAPSSIKVLDFGIAKVAASETATGATGGLTGTGMMLGTPYYMSPEQIFGDKDIDHRADIWALGVIFFECLSGERPTQADNIGQIIKMVTMESLPDLAVAMPTIPRDLTGLVSRMLTRDRRQRPQTLAEVQALLRRYTDVAARSFGEPAAHKSNPPRVDSGLGDSGGRVRTGDRSASEFADTALPAMARSAGGTNSATAADRITAGVPRRGSTALFLAMASVVVGGAVGLGVWRMNASHAPTTEVSPPPAAKPQPTPSSDPSTTTAPPSSVSAEPLTTASASKSVAPPTGPAPRPAKEPTKAATAPSPTPTPTAPVASVPVASPPPSTTKTQPGGIVEKSPY
ncbi:MAG: protein kinase [Myxococcales bacterium]|nr:protein kinase [Myxococcales bacterium]